MVPLGRGGQPFITQFLQSVFVSSKCLYDFYTQRRVFNTNAIILVVVTGVVS